MKGNSELETQLGKVSDLAVFERLSERTFRWQSALAAVQHPATLLLLTVSIVSIIYLLLVSPILGGGLWATVLIVVSGIVAATSYLLRYTKEYAKRARELMDLLERERGRLEQAELRRLSETLQVGFFTIASSEGLKALGELASEYEQLQPAFARRAEGDPLSLSLIPALATETYRRGLSLLLDAKGIMETAHTPDKERIESEIAELEKEVEDLKGRRRQAERLKIREGTLASHRQRLDMLGHLQLKVDQLLYEAHRCEASLHRTRIELASIRAGNSETTTQSVIETLQKTIRQMKEVQDEITRLGY